MTRKIPMLSCSCMTYDPFDLNPPKSLIKQTLKGFKAEASKLLADIALLRQSLIADWLVEDLEAEHRKLLNKIKRYEMYLADIPISTDYQQTVVQVKQRLIADFFPSQLRKSGNKLYGRCPFHPDKRPSFVVYLSNNSWYCFGCGIGGDSIAFIQKLNGLDFKSAVRLLGG